MKVDVLALGMLTCIRKAFVLLPRSRTPIRDLADMPREDPAVYGMLQRGDCVGVFQVESRAQMNMLPRLQAGEFYDLVIEVAIVRPGPIQGDMVHPYLRRRHGQEKVEFPSPAPEHGPPDELERVLGKTLGVPLFQEQAMRIAIEAAKFTPEEANALRRAMATFRHVGTIHAVLGEDGRGDGGARLRPRLRRALLPPDRGLRHLRLPREPRGEFRASGLCLGVAEMPSSGGVRLRAAEFAADGVLRPGADRPRRARARRERARHRCQCSRRGIGCSRATSRRCGWGSG